MTWDAEFGPYYEVPGFLPFLVRKKIVEDMSWHNDVAPSFGLYSEQGKTEREIRLWVDHPFKSQREVGGTRFWVADSVDHEPQTDFSTDDFEEALDKLFTLLGAYHKGMKAGVLEWRPDNLLGSEWDDPKEYLEELKKEFFADPRA